MRMGRARACSQAHLYPLYDAAARSEHKYRCTDMLINAPPAEEMLARQHDDRVDDEIRAAAALEVERELVRQTILALAGRLYTILLRLRRVLPAPLACTHVGVLRGVERRRRLALEGQRSVSHMRIRGVLDRLVIHSTV